MDVTIIIPLSRNVPTEVIESVLEHHRTNHHVPILISRTNDSIFNLSKARNMGACMTRSKWLLFCDADIVFSKDIQEMTDINQPVVRGTIRRDDIDPVHRYKCANSPILIQRDFYFDVGGYCELYRGWGYEDSDFEHKLPVAPVDYNAEALHIMKIHNEISGNKLWKYGSDDNKELFIKRMSEPVEKRINDDKQVLTEYLK